MSQPKLLVFMIDALCESDITHMRTLKHFGWMLENGALVREMLPVYPSFTYPCHVSIMTGCYPDKHGIPHNEQVKAGVHPVPWYTSRKLVKKKFFAEYAKERGFSTCLVNWPVSAGADVDINLPMCMPMSYRGDDPRQFFEGVSSEDALNRYFWKYGYLLCGCNKVLNGSLDDFTNAVSPDIIRDYGQPDVMFVKMCDLDTVRHKLGVDSDTAKFQLEKHDCELGVLMESIRRYGDFEHTNFVVMGDHGQTDVSQVLNFNRAFQNAGLQRLDENGKLESFDAYCHSTGASGWIELRDPNDASLRERVYRFLLDAKESGKYGWDTSLPKKKPKRSFTLTDRLISSSRAINRCPLAMILPHRCSRQPRRVITKPHRERTAVCLGAIIGQHFSPAGRRLKRVLSLIAPASWMKRRRWLKSSDLKWKILTVIALTLC